MRRIILFLFLLTPVVAVSQNSQSGPSKDQLAQAPTLNIAELLARPDTYDKTLVRVNALWVEGYHGSYACPLDNQNNCMSAECADDDACKAVTKVVQKNLTGELWNRSGRFILVGRFIDTKTPPGMNRPRFEFWVFKVDKVLKVSRH